NDWTKNLDHKIFPEVLITTTLDTYDRKTFSSYVDFLNIIDSKEKKLFEPLNKNFYSIDYDFYNLLGLNSDVLAIDEKFQDYIQLSLYDKSTQLPQFVETIQIGSNKVLQKFYNNYWEENKAFLSNRFEQDIRYIDASKIEIENEKDQFTMLLQILSIKNTIDKRIKQTAIQNYESTLESWNLFITQNYQDSFKEQIGQIQSYFNINLDEVKTNDVDPFQLAYRINEIINE
ncbi:2598_t:CDS:1, partial [Racocetra persica]